MEEKNAHSQGFGYRFIGILVAVSLISAIIGGVISAYITPNVRSSVPEATPSDRQIHPADGQKQVIKAGDLVSPATAVANRLKPSVVNISVNQGPRDAIHSGLVGGVGSGVIYRDDGYIITNNHVISGAREVFVTIGTDEIKARLVAADPETDLAVLKVDKKGLNAAEFGSTKSLQVGEPAIAIGSPFGFEYTVTSGIISALNRTVTIPDEETGGNITFTNLIQTDAAINPGNSGGVLSDATGKVIGINTLIISSSGAYEGVGFAIPVETVRSVADQLIEKGKASHPYMGIYGRDARDIVAADSSAPIKKGAVIVEVVPGSPAAKAGLRKEDIITAVDNTSIEDMDDLIAEVRQREVGDSIKITYFRNGKEHKVDLTLTEKPRQ
ncbi:MAG: trypsin-like peptidase domain-containing protein [Actinomycetota bacterium]|nr:trypsin-like peptidase domain-containing protein [Actinomycetota bacterium]